jgi:hypothetical protein
MQIMQSTKCKNAIHDFPYLSKLIPFYHTVHRLQRYSRFEIKWTSMCTVGIRDQKTRIRTIDLPCLVENGPQIYKKQRWKMRLTQEAQCIYFVWQSFYKWAPNPVLQINTSCAQQNKYWINVFKHVFSSSRLLLLSALQSMMHLGFCFTVS